MRFPFNASDPVIQELLQYAGSEQLLEQAMHNSYYSSKDRSSPISIDSIIEHIKKLKDA